MTSAMTSPITVTHNPGFDQLEQLGVQAWPIWSCRIFPFPWTYDKQETCLLLEGDVTVTPDGGDPVYSALGIWWCLKQA
jgi:uncharacterized cupin superfamily protein